MGNQEVNSSGFMFLHAGLMGLTVLGVCVCVCVCGPPISPFKVCNVCDQ